MKKESIYLDTSVPSAYYDNKVKERQKETIKFWKSILPNYNVFVSEITLGELKNTKNLKLRGKFIKLIKPFKVLKTNKKIRDLTLAYIDNRIFPEKYIDDAHHVAIASFYEVSFLASWNFEHIVKVKTRKLVNSINVLNNYKEIEIVSPQEL